MVIFSEYWEMLGMYVGISITLWCQEERKQDFITGEE